MAADPARRILLHPGFHKTGTTSVQHALAAHARMLAPVARVVTVAGRDPLLRLAITEARRFSAGRGRALARLRVCLQLWAEALDLAPGQGLILSCEDFAGCMPGDRGVTDYAASLPIARVLTEVLRLRFPGARLQMIYGTRAPAPWLESLHWQLAKHDAMTEDAADFAARLAPAVEVAPVLAQIAAATGAELLTAPLERHGVRRLGPVEALYDAIGLPDALRASLPVVPAANRAPGGLAAAFVALNRQPLSPEARAAAKDRLLGR